MIALSALRPSSLLALVAGFALVVPMPSGAVASEWTRDDATTRFRRREAAGERIDPDAFDALLLAAAIFQETNHQRANLGLPAFLPDDRASQAAHQHARWMAANHRLAHDEPAFSVHERLMWLGQHPHIAAENIAFDLLPEITPGKPFYTRLVDGRREYSYRAGGPALPTHTYQGFARTMVWQWLQSPPHRAHLVDPDLRFLGVGVALAHRHGHPDTIYGAQDFYTPHTPATASVTNFAGRPRTRLGQGVDHAF